jgi:hypothetical protein
MAAAAEAGQRKRRRAAAQVLRRAARHYRLTCSQQAQPRARGVRPHAGVRCF